MIEQVIKEIIDAETHAEQIIAEAQSKATEISLKTGELLESETARRNEKLKQDLSQIACKAETEGTRRREEILSFSKDEADKMYQNAKTKFAVAADSVINIILGE